MHLHCYINCNRGFKEERIVCVCERACLQNTYLHNLPYDHECTQTMKKFY